ncbi:MAG: TIGR03790 family protein [Verrucomicrobiota bacterium]
MTTICKHKGMALAKLWLLLSAVMVADVYAGEGEQVVVIYNRKMPESKQVAEHYAQQRRVPATQVFGLDLPVAEEISRSQFEQQLQTPLLQVLLTNQFMVYGPPTTNASKRFPVQAKIRYVLLCYGVPLKITHDLSHKDPVPDASVPEPFRVNHAAVDSELACLPLNEGRYPLIGIVQNPVYSMGDLALFHPTNGVLMVTRLDGPSAAIAMGLVNKAIEAETNGFWGRAYIDLRGLTNGPLMMGESWMGMAAQVCFRDGMETVVDTHDGAFTAGFPLSHIAFFAGWRNDDVSAPYSRPHLEFMPGAFAYYLYSYGAATIRSATQHCVGPFLAKGATCTMGCVYEPYLGGTPNVGMFAQRWLKDRFTFGEAAYACQGLLSWQTTFVGDPLYRPTKQPPPAIHSSLAVRRSRLIEWSHLKVANLNLVLGYPIAEAVGYLEGLPETRSSSVLLEMLGELYWRQKNYSACLVAYEDAFKQEVSPQQRVRMMLTFGEHLAFMGRDGRAIELYERFVKEQPEYPEKSVIYRRLAKHARSLGRPADAEKYGKLAGEK